MKTPTKELTTSESEIERMLKNSQTKVLVPVLTYGLVKEHASSGKIAFSDADIRKAYEAAVKSLQSFLGHDVHIGAKYYDAYGTRMSRYGVLEPTGHLKYRLLPPYTTEAVTLTKWIPEQIKNHIEQRLGIVPLLREASARVALAEDSEGFLRLIGEQIAKTPSNFEIFTFAVLKVHLEKFACKIYRDTRTSAHDKGVDLSTNFGVVYQVKRLTVRSESEANRIYAELELNFDKERLQAGNVILVIDDISKEIRQYLIDMKVQSISKVEVLKLAANFCEPEDRQRVLRIVYEEFRREYSSAIK
jgi:hypothetical protein